MLRLGDKGLEDPGHGLEWDEIRHGKNNKQLLKCSMLFIVKANTRIIEAGEVLNAAAFTFSALVDDDNKSQSE